MLNTPIVIVKHKKNNFNKKKTHRANIMKHY